VRKRTATVGGPIPVHGARKLIDPEEADALWDATKSPAGASHGDGAGTPISGSDLARAHHAPPRRVRGRLAWLVAAAAARSSTVIDGSKAGNYCRLEMLDANDHEESCDMPTLKPEHEVALRCLHWLPADVRPTAELLAELMCVSDHEATQMLAELLSARLLASARARGIPCAALERRGPRRAPIGTGKVGARERGRRPRERRV